MYSLLPALVSLLFLGYGTYVVVDKGFTRTTTSFFALCITTFFWQFTWAVLFQVRDPSLAMALVKLGYLLILFLPTSLYHFLTEITERGGERPYVYLSYAFSALLAAALLASDQLIAGYYEYFWGYYPKAGPLHPLHLLQTTVVVSRGLYITYRQQQAASAGEGARLRLCLVSLFIYFLAAIDYLCNYGIEFYPPGVVFIAISLGMIAIAIVKYRLLSPLTLAASVAHEVRTPLLTIRSGATGLSHYLPQLLEGYRLAVEHKLCEPRIRQPHLHVLRDLTERIAREADRSNRIIDMMLAATALENLDTAGFGRHAIQACVDEAVAAYPFGPDELQRVRVSVNEAFEFYGSDTLLVCVLFNLLKNALYALKQAGKGDIEISVARDSRCNRLVFTDTGTGISPETMPRVFQSFFTTKRKDKGTGVGLAFCEGVMRAFGGRISCASVPGEYTTFTLEFPHPA